MNCLKTPGIFLYIKIAPSDMEIACSDKSDCLVRL